MQETTKQETMTMAQMNWNFREGYAWYGTYADGSLMNEWTHPVYTRRGPWFWDAMEQVYVLEN